MLKQLDYLLKNNEIFSLEREKKEFLQIILKILQIIITKNVMNTIKSVNI